jgi:hypothetical protein
VSFCDLYTAVPEQFADCEIMSLTILDATAVQKVIRMDAPIRVYDFYRYSHIWNTWGQ